MVDQWAVGVCLHSVQWKRGARQVCGQDGVQRLGANDGTMLE
jgi:hypothetical protein